MYPTKSRSPNFVAAGTIGVCTFVKPSGVAGLGGDHQVVQAGLGDDPCGIAQEQMWDVPSEPDADPTVAARAGNPLEIHGLGEYVPIIFGGTVNAGDWLKPDANGHAITATAAGDKVGARAVESGTAGRKGLVQVIFIVLGDTSSMVNSVTGDTHITASPTTGAVGLTLNPATTVLSVTALTNDVVVSPTVGNVTISLNLKTCRASRAALEFGTPAIPMGANLSTPVGNTDASTQLQAWFDAIYAAGGGIAYIDGAVMCGEVGISSNTYVTFGVMQSYRSTTQAVPTRGAIQKPKSQCIFCNKNRISNYVTSFTGNTSNGSATVTSLSSTALLAVGQTITGAGIPASTTILTLGSTSVTLSQSATADGTAVALIAKVEDFSRIVDHDLGVFDAFLNGNFAGGNATSANNGQGDNSSNAIATNWADAYSATGGKFIYPLDFNGVRNLHTSRIWFFDYVYGAMEVTYCDHHICREHVLISYPDGSNYHRTSDGIDHRAGCRDVVIQNCVTWNSDDTFMIQSDPSATFFENDNYRALFYSGDMTGFRVINNIQHDTNGPQVSMYSGSERGSHLIDDVLIEGNSTPTDIIMSTLGAAGNYGRVKIANHYCSGSKFLFCETGVVAIHVEICNSTAALVGSPTIGTVSSVEVSGTFHHLDIHGLCIRDSGQNAGSLVYMTDPRSVFLSAISWSRTQSVRDFGYSSVQGCVLEIKGAPTGKIFVHDVNTVYVANIVKLSNSSTPLQLSLDGVGHGLSGNNPTIYVADTSEVPHRLRASGVDTVLLTHTLSGYKTDGFEDGVIAFDDFTGTDGTNLTAHAFTTGANPWVSQEGTIAIQGNMAEVTIDGVDGFALYTVDTGKSDCKISVIMPPTGGIHQSIVFRFTDLSNYWRLQWNFTGATLELHKIVAGIDTQVGSTLSINVGFQNLFVVECIGSSIEWSAQSTIDQSFPGESATDSFNQTATKHGIRGQVGALFDNILVNTSPQ